MSGAAQRAGAPANAHAHAPTHDHGAVGSRAHGQDRAVIDFLSGRIGLASHVLVALNHSLPRSQVARLVTAFRAGASLAKQLETKGRAPAELLADPAFEWTAMPGFAGHILRPVPRAALDPLVAKLADTIRDDLADESRQSPKVLLEAVLVAQRNHQLEALCAHLREMRDASHGTCFDALLAVMRVEGGEGLRSVLDGALDHAGVTTAADPAIAELSQHDRLVRAGRLGAHGLSGEVLEQLVGMIPVVVAFSLAAQVTPVGWALDVLGIALGGQQALQVIEDLRAFHTLAIAARNQHDLETAGKRLARAIAAIGITGVFAIIGARRRQSATAKAQTSPQVPHTARSERVSAAQTQHTPVTETRHESAETNQATRATARVTGQVLDHAADIGEQIPEGWSVEKQVHVHDENPAHRRIETWVRDPAGHRSHFIRVYDAETKQLIFKEAFLSPQSPRWVQHSGAMMTAKGTPTQSFWTIRQVNMMKLAASDVKSVKMNDIQNMRTILQLAAAKRDGIDPSEALARSASVQYAATPLTQLGMNPVPGTLQISGGLRGSIDSIMAFQELHRLTDRADGDALLREFGFKRQDVVHMCFDITFEVSAKSGVQR